MWPNGENKGGQVKERQVEVHRRKKKEIRSCQKERTPTDFTAYDGQRGLSGIRQKGHIWVESVRSEGVGGGSP